MTTGRDIAHQILHEGALATAHAPIDVDEARELLYQHFGIVGAFDRLMSEKDDLFAVACVDGSAYVVKFAHASESPDVIDFQLKAMEHAARRDPGIPLPRVVRTRDAEPFTTTIDTVGTRRITFVLTFVEGTLMRDADPSSADRRKVGALLARLRLALADFSHAADSRRVAWDVRHISELRPLLAQVQQFEHRAMLEAGLDRLDMLAQQISSLPVQVVHNDLNMSNVLVDRLTDGYVTGIIDFGDAVRTAAAIDVATALAGQLPRTPGVRDEQTLFGGAREFLRGYLTVAGLTREEILLLPHLMLGRLVAYGLITSWRSATMAGSAYRILVNDELKWDRLRWYLDRPADSISTIFADITS